MGFHIHLSGQNTNKNQNVIQLDVHAQPPQAVCTTHLACIFRYNFIKIGHAVEAGQ